VRGFLAADLKVGVAHADVLLCLFMKNWSLPRFSKTGAEASLSTVEVRSTGNVEIQ
jgi:hypothetical protein